MKLIILLFIISLTPNCYSQSIRGKVLDTYTKRPLSNTFVYLIEPDNSEDTIDIYYWRYNKYKIIKETKTDSSGNYSFKTLTPKIYNIAADFPMPESEYGGYGIRNDIDSNVIIKLKTNYYKTFNLMVTCPYDKSKNQAFCPQCKKEDRVIPIIWGLPVWDENGIINGGKEYYPGGCSPDVYCNPTKHCNRCDKDF